MKKSFITKALLCALAIAVGALAHAFPTSHFATTSKLATGKWVKVAIPTTGVYEITDEELLQMGFSNPENVRLYGVGGRVMSEVLTASNFVDDLQPLPAQRLEGKLCFYAQGPVAFDINLNTTIPSYNRVLNIYSTHGYYFLTEESGEAATVPQLAGAADAATTRSTSLGCFYHENDMISIGQSGKIILGENMEKPFVITPALKGIVDGSTMAVTPSMAALMNTSNGTIGAKINSTDVTFESYYNIPPPFNASGAYFETRTPTGFVTVNTNGSDDVNVELNVTSDAGVIKMARLDYLVLTYERLNALSSDSHQVKMGLNNLTADNRVTIDNATATTQVWDVSTPASPQAYPLTQTDGNWGFAPGIVSSWKEYVAFDPAQTLLKISSFEAVENQDLHAMETPHMLIITHKNMLEQAQRIARLHNTCDGIDVAVVQHDKIFNEFSSGTPDVMAYRLLCKMLYDRNPQKFQNLLMLGRGTYDNRQLFAKQDNALLTYQSEASGEETETYCTDDFYGMLADGSGTNVNRAQLTIGVGRIPSRTVEEAKTDIDKLEKYVVEPNYDEWRNDFFVLGDDYDNGLHEFQAEGLNNTIMSNVTNTMANNKMYVRQFYRPDFATAGQESTHTTTQGREAIAANLKDGQYFMSYIGHAGSSTLGKKANLWNSSMVAATPYPHLPIVSLACCNVARYDNPGGNEGIAEKMFHKADGGAIALLASGRSCMATDNDRLNTAFANALFCYNTKGVMPTLGEAYKNAKLVFGTATNSNKLTFMLMGDPAIKVNYPKPFFKITKVNGNDVTGGETVEGNLMQHITIEAQVMNADGSAVNTGFNGDATASLYGPERYFRSIKQGSTTRDIYYPREKYAQVKGRVENGVFTASMIVPQSVTIEDGECIIRVYAHEDNTTEMVNGLYANLTLAPADPATAVVDNEAPVIDAIFFNDNQDFAYGDIIPANSILHITASDDVAINVQRGAVAGAMSLSVDNGDFATPYAYDYANVTNGGRDMTLSMPLNGLPKGKHTLTFTVFDIDGKMASKTVAFIVGETAEGELTVNEYPAIESANFDFSTTLASQQQVTLKVMDNVGNVVWKDDNAQFPLTWDLKDTEGNRVKAGIYKAYATVNDGATSAGTPIISVVVLDPHKTAN